MLNHILEAAYLVVGAILLGLAAVGLASPLVPTVPFLLLAAFSWILLACLCRADPRQAHRPRRRSPQVGV